MTPEQLAEIRAGLAVHEGNYCDAPTARALADALEQAWAALEGSIKLAGELWAARNEAIELRARAERAGAKLARVLAVNSEHRNALTARGRHPERQEDCQCLGCQSVRAIIEEDQ